MINGHFGIPAMPFQSQKRQLLEHQKEILEAIRVHRFQRGFCLVVGEPGTGKSVIRDALTEETAHQVTPSIGRTLHTYSNTLRILCESLGIEYEGGDLKCEKQVIQEVHRLNHIGKAVTLIIDDAHLLELKHLRKLRLLFEEMSQNYAIILLAQTELMPKLALSVNTDLRSRISYSSLLRKLNPEQAKAFILDSFDQCELAHNRIEEAALNLISSACDGILRNIVNLTLSSMVQAVRAQSKNISLNHVNTALLQPHWREADHWLQNPDG